MSKGRPVHVWRITECKKERIFGRSCPYCSHTLSPKEGAHEITKDIIANRQAESQTVWFGKELDKMTTEDWVVHLSKNEESNRACPDTNWPMPTDKEGSIEVYWFAQGFQRTVSCPTCGWWGDFINYNHGATFERTAEAAMRTFSVNDSELTIPEVSSHLSKYYSDVYSLNPRRFEEVIAHVYQNIGWDVTLTKQSRDGGVDIYCLSKGGEMCIVECKRYSRDRSVGIAAVDRLLGVAYRSNASTAHLVTTSTFSSPAFGVANLLKKSNGIELTLVDAHQLSVLLDLYTDKDLTVDELQRSINKKKS